MENGSRKEQQPLKPEISSSVHEFLSERLGFTETEELKAIRDYAVEASKKGDNEGVNTLVLEYQLRGEELVDNLEGSEYMCGQIGFIVAMAILHKDTGNLKAFLNDIADAKEYAFNAQEDETVTVLERMPSGEIARILSMYGEEFGFDEQTITELAAEPYEEAFEIAYGYLTQIGLDADEILNDFMDDPLESNQDTE